MSSRFHYDAHIVDIISISRPITVVYSFLMVQDPQADTLRRSNKKLSHSESPKNRKRKKTNSDIGCSHWQKVSAKRQTSCWFPGPLMRVYSRTRRATDYEKNGSWMSTHSTHELRGYLLCSTALSRSGKRKKERRWYIYNTKKRVEAYAM